MITIDYRRLAQYLFEGCPNLKKNRDGSANKERVWRVLQVELGVNEEIARRMCKTMRELGFLYLGSGSTQYYPTYKD